MNREPFKNLFLKLFLKKKYSIELKYLRIQDKYRHLNIRYIHNAGAVYKYKYKEQHKLYLKYLDMTKTSCNITYNFFKLIIFVFLS